MAKQIPVPVAVAGMKLLSRIDYEDAFEVETAGARSARDSANLMIDSAPPPLLAFARVAHSFLFGRRLPPPDAEHPLGWTILEDQAHSLVLGLEGPRGSARLVGVTSPGRLSLSTLTRFDSVRSRIAWPFLAPFHRAIARFVLDRTAKATRVAHARSSPFNLGLQDKGIGPAA